MKKRMVRLAASVMVITLTMGSISYAAGDWTQQNGNWYYINRDGMTVSRQMMTIGSQKYAFGDDGAMVHDAWYYNYPDEKWYYMGGDGVAITGWKQLNSSWYYFLSSGAMAADGWRTIEGTKYYFNEDGTMKQNGYVGEKYVDSNGVGDSRYDIKVRGKTDKEVLEEAGDMTENIPGWLLNHIFSSGWKIACNAEKETYGKYNHEDYDDYERYFDLETGRSLIFFIYPEYILQGIGLYVNHRFGKPAGSVDFQGAYSVDYDRVSGMFPQQPILERNADTAFAEVFALYYSDDEDVRTKFQEECPSLNAYMDTFMAESYVKATQAK